MNEAREITGVGDVMAEIQKMFDEDQRTYIGVTLYQLANAANMAFLGRINANNDIAMEKLTAVSEEGCYLIVFRPSANYHIEAMAAVVALNDDTLSILFAKNGTNFSKDDPATIKARYEAVENQLGLHAVMWPTP